MRLGIGILVISVTLAVAQSGWAQAEPKVKGAKIGSFGQEVRQFYTTADGLPSDDVYALAVDVKTGDVFAGTATGMAQFTNGKWKPIPALQGEPVRLVTAAPDGKVSAVFRGSLCDGAGAPIAPLPSGLGSADAVHCLAGPGFSFLGTDQGLFSLQGGALKPLKELNARLGQDKAVRCVALAPNLGLAVGTASGLFLGKPSNVWEELRPSADARAWWPNDVRGVAFDQKGSLWFATPQGVGCLADKWTLYTGADGVPYDDFTAVATAPDGGVWFGTTKGAIHFDGTHWAYRQGLRWLPDDQVRAVAVGPNGDAWFATPKGVGVIRTQPMTFAEKAKFYEDEIDKYHRRTEYQYVLEVGLKAPGDKTEFQQGDSDNDGLWTSMYGAGECFAYAATKDPKAKARAQQAWKALKFLGDVTQGGSNPAPPGFVARTVLPTGTGYNPNEKDYTPERDREGQKGDKKWKVMSPRWPTSADGKWYWKSDTSSDELDGHYFFYAVYYDLVAETEEEKAPVRERVKALTDHLIEHDFCLVDHDGKPTRWAVYSPAALNHDPNWFMERGLNSLSMLSYLAVAEHVTGDPKYRQAADMLIKEHNYAQNTLVSKIHMGPGSGNQSDDEMAFMSYYNLLNYEKDPALKQIYALSLFSYWRIEEPEMNPLFNFIYAASCLGKEFKDAFGDYPLSSGGTEWLDDAVETLKRFPLDRFNWRHTNNSRKDLALLPKSGFNFDERDYGRRGCRVNGKVIPVDEQFFNHWNHNLFELSSGGNGAELADGAVFTLPYYMGLYHGFIVE